MDFLRWEMDFIGQKTAERLSQVIIVLFAAVGWIYGYMVQKYSMTVYIGGAGYVLALLLCSIPWPMYQMNPVKWRKPEVVSTAGVDTVDTPKGKKKKAAGKDK
ncbi:signal peptidase complex subunit 1-like isoform X2 [Artemia franciscana]|uniref:signal peptidase complex subunit 1-like isoform X2 n=1 Tax=Artemia franciscana TaxID=6661 RepID=UPI0032DB96C6